MIGQRQMRFILALPLAAILSTITAPATAVEVTFPDANLEAAVREHLDIPAGPITDTDMESLQICGAYFARIANIEGLEYGTNLKTVALRWNQISDISPLADLTSLTELALNANQISDVSSVARLTNLNYLDLGSNRISDISPVAGLTNLNELWLEGNQISDISPVARLTNMHQLYLSDNQISDISPLAGLTDMVGLELNNNRISDISAVAEMTKFLRSLELNDNQISDISPLAGSTDLIDVRLNNNQISDTSPAAGLHRLGSLRLADNRIETLDLRGAEFYNLTTFDIGQNPLKSVLLADAVVNSKSFNTLIDGGVYGYTGIAEMPMVLRLDMSGADFAPIEDVSAMYTMDNLETLILNRATNLDGSDVAKLTTELDSLNWLDVTGLWDSFGTSTQNTLRTWDAAAGHTLVVPEPGSIALLLCGAIGLLACAVRRRRRAA